MAKKKTEGQKAAEAESKKDPKRAHVRAQLRASFPFLRNEYRPLKKSELNSEKVFAELFPNDEYSLFKLYRLKAIYEYQI